MTGVGKDRTSKLHGADVRVLCVQRPELVLEALPVGGGRCDSLIFFDDVAASVVHLHQHHFSFLPLFLISWVELSFLYKPTSIHQPLPMVAPFQPRLDWQMWFAALSSYEREPWLLVLIYQLLRGSSSAWQLMGGQAQSFAAAPPRAMRVTMFHYDLSVAGGKNGSAV